MSNRHIKSILGIAEFVQVVYRFYYQEYQEHQREEKEHQRQEKESRRMQNQLIMMDTLISLSSLLSLLLLSSKNSLSKTVNFVVWIPDDYQAMSLDKIAELKRRKTKRIVIYFLIAREFGPLILRNALGSLQKIFRKDRA